MFFVQCSETRALASGILMLKSKEICMIAEPAHDSPNAFCAHFTTLSATLWRDAPSISASLMLSVLLFIAFPLVELLDYTLIFLVVK